MRSGTHTTAGFVLALLLTVSCSDRPGQQPPAPAARPSILLVTLDTTRADAIGPGAQGIETPAFNALAARGRRFRQAYATVPETLPSHSSMMTGLYPAGHGVHENARFLGADQALLAESLGRAGYRTAAFVSSFVLSRRFGLSRGFEHYDDEPPGAANERDAAATTERALAYLAQQDSSSRCSSGSTTSIPTRLTNRRRRSGPATPHPTSAKSPPSTSSSGAWRRPSKRGARRRR